MDTRTNWSRRRAQPGEVASSNEVAQAMNDHNARVHSAVDEALLCIARWALAIVAGTVLGVHALNVIAGALQ